jgi:hypothetical protein
MLITKRLAHRRAGWSLLLALSFGVHPVFAHAADTAALAGTSITVSFKFDPGPTYGGVRWVSPRTFTSGLQGGKQAIVDATVQAIDARKIAISVSPQWTAADPTMVVVAPLSPNATDQFRITVLHAGESKLTVNAAGVSKDLLIKAKVVGKGIGMQVSITQ